MKAPGVAAGTLATVVLAVAAWAALAPLAVDSRDEPFEIPKGTWARRMAGDKVELLLRNLDDVPQQFGPVLVMPGQSFRLPFEKASTYSFDCTAHASGQMTIVVAEAPATPWDRIRWRWNQFNKKTRA